MHIADFLPLQGKYRQFVVEVENDLLPADFKRMQQLLKRRQVGVVNKSFGLSPALNCDVTFSQLSLAKEVEDITASVDNINHQLEQAAFERAAQKLSKDSLSILAPMVAPHIVCDTAIKQAAALQLFSNERFHILLLGDPGTGKTEIIRASSEMHPIHNFGLGSGATGVGLSVTVKGKEVIPGLLPSASEGICALDELNLLAEKERGALYNAMEKGFITYNKGGQKLQFDADVRVIATANPKGDRFIGKDIKFLKQQIPFDSALMSRFHLVFVMRMLDMKSFKKVTEAIVRHDKKKMNKSDKEFIARYIDYAHDIDVDFSKTLESEIVDWVTSKKENEKSFLVDISPRTVLGIVRVAQAHARMHLRDEVRDTDLKAALTIFEKSLEVPVPEQRFQR